MDTVLDSIRAVDISDAAISLFGLPVDREHLLTWPVVNLWPEQSHAALADILRAVSAKTDATPEFRRIETVGRLDAVSLMARRSTQVGQHDTVILQISGTVRTRAVREDAMAPVALPDPRGHPELRAQIASDLAISRGIGCVPDQIILTSGYKNGLFLAITTLQLHGRSV